MTNVTHPKTIRVIVSHVHRVMTAMTLAYSSEFFPCIGQIELRRRFSVTTRSLDCRGGLH
jgi:hypothetical protein